MTYWVVSCDTIQYHVISYRINGSDMRIRLPTSSPCIPLPIVLLSATRRVILPLFKPCTCSCNSWHSWHSWHSCNLSHFVAFCGSSSWGKTYPLVPWSCRLLPVLWLVLLRNLLLGSWSYCWTTVELQSSWSISVGSGVPGVTGVTTGGWGLIFESSAYIILKIWIPIISHYVTSSYNI